MSPVYSTDAQYLEAEAVDLHRPDAAVQVRHHLRDDSGNVTDYWLTLTPEDARRLARQLRKAARLADHPETQEANG